MTVTIPCSSSESAVGRGRQLSSSTSAPNMPPHWRSPSAYGVGKRKREKRIVVSRCTKRARNKEKAVTRRDAEKCLHGVCAVTAKDDETNEISKKFVLNKIKKTHHPVGIIYSK